MKKYLLILVVFMALVNTGNFVVAEDLGPQCAAVTESNTGCPDLSSSECKALLLRCADYYDQQSAQLSQDITKTSAQF